jgi:hypothetical protein
MDAPSPGLDEPAQLSSFQSIEQPFIGRWNRLVSTTNWEKGRIIQQWREAFVAAGASANDYSDDAWSLRVGGVSGQHVGRLRRVFQRFGANYEQYRGLFWSHFQAAVDWDDAEMWLEGAVQNDWSVIQMRRTRLETIEGVGATLTTESQQSAIEADEDYVGHGEYATAGGSDHSEVSEFRVPEGADFGEEPTTDSYGSPDSDSEPREAVALMRPFEKLAELPPDFADAFEAFKLSILRHKSEGWQQISRDDVLGALDALKELAIAPME